MAVEIAVRCSVCKDYVDPNNCAHVLGTFRDGYRGDVIADGEYVLCSVECVARFLGVSGGSPVELPQDESALEESFDYLAGGVDTPGAGDHLEQPEEPGPPPPPQKPHRKAQPKKVQPRAQQPAHVAPDDIRYLFEHGDPPEGKPVHSADSVPLHLRDTIPTGDEGGLYSKALESRLRRSLPHGSE